MRLIEIHLGAVSIVIHENDLIMLERNDGEAAEITKAELDRLLSDYYDEIF